jgi:Bacterial pre-peptidase C-terminal domain
VTVPAGTTSLVFNISSGTGDADLYVRLGAAPTTTTYNCRPYTGGNAETCTFNNPTAGSVYYANVRAYSAYSGVTLKATRTP